MEKETREEPKKVMGLRVSALLEMAIFFAVLLLADALLGGGTRFFTVCPHPFWVIVLLAAAQYGTAEGLAAALAATAALLLFNLPEQTIQQSMYDYLYLVAKTPLLWLVAAVSLGELRQKHIRERNRLREELDTSQVREEKIAQTYQWTRELKERLELRIAGQLRSSVAAYRAARNMEAQTPGEVLRGLEELLAALMNPEKFSIYLLKGDNLTLALTHGWRETEPLNREFATRSDLARAVIGARQVITLANEDQERILSGQGVMAGPLLDKTTGEVFGMIKIEKLGFADLNLSTVETFSSICEWAGMAIANARRYQTAKEGSIINPDHNLLTESYFRRYSKYITQLGKRVGFDVTQVVIRLANAAELAPESRVAVARTLASAVDSVLRGVDLAFDYQGNGEEYSIILPATPRQGAEIVLGKIRGALIPGLSGDAARAQFDFSIQTLNEQGK